MRRAPGAAAVLALLLAGAAGGSPGNCRGLPGNCRAALGQPDPGTLGQPDPGASGLGWERTGIAALPAAAGSARESGKRLLLGLSGSPT
jgi:hypothetical protein